jgi:glycosyltransferase involved in cell wall biosynthesis
LLNSVAPGDWVLFLDADERFTLDDARALQRFVAAEARPGFAYGFQVHRTSDDLERYEVPGGTWVYRLFQREPDQTLPERLLHFPPVPTSIPRRMWLRTSIPLLHVATTSSDDGEARWVKYQGADPDREWQASYDHLRQPPESLRPLPRRSGPVVLPIHDRNGEIRPTISVIVISQDDEDRIEEVVRSIAAQEVCADCEVIVVTSGTDRTADIVRRGFPTVTVVEMDRPSLPGGARNAGLAVASGDIVVFVGSHIELTEGSLQARLDAHEEGWAMVTGTVLNGSPTRAGWATYFLDHWSLLPGRPSGELSTAPTRCSYVRFLLDRVGGFPDTVRAGEDTAVNLELWRQGFSAYRCREAAEVHTSLIGDTTTLIRRHHERGIAWAAILRARYGSSRIVLLRRWWHLLAYAPRRLLRIHRGVRAWGGGLRSPYRRAAPLIVFGALAAWAGVLRGLAARVEPPGRRADEPVPTTAAP